MKLKRLCILRRQRFCLQLLLALFGSILTLPNALAQESIKADEEAEPSPPSDRFGPTTPVEPDAVSEMPDISGVWTYNPTPPAPDDVNRDFIAPPQNFVVRRSTQAGVDFEYLGTREPTAAPRKIKWESGGRFHTLPAGDYLTQLKFFELSPDGNQLMMLNLISREDATRLAARAGITVDEFVSRYINQTWQRAETPAVAEDSKETLSDVVKRLSQKDKIETEPASPPAKIGVPLPNTPAANDLLKRLEAQESAAATAANEIRRLQANGDAAETIAPHQAQLKAHLQSAFELKMQLEELQVKELQSRLSRLERQIGQRKELRDKIIERRAAELLNPDVSWENTATKTSVAVPPIAGATDRDGGRRRDPLPNPNAIRLRCDRRMSINDGTEVVFVDNGQVAIMSVSSDRPVEFSFVEGAENSRGPFLLSFQYNDSDATAATWLANNVLPVEFLAGDQDRATSGQLVEKVVYVDSASGAVGTISSHTIEPGVNPLNVAADKGIIIGVVRISKGVLKTSASTDETTNTASTQKNAPPPNTAATKVNDPRGPGIEAIAARLDTSSAAIKNLSVTTDYKKRHVYGLPFDAPIELTFVTKTIIDNEGRLRVETAGQQINIEPDGKSARAYNGRWETVFQKGEARSLTWYESNPPTASIDNFPSLHGIHPQEFTTHFQSKPVSEIIRTSAAEVTERVMWDDRPVTIVQTTPHQNANDARRYRFWIDQERNVVVRRAISIRYAEGQPWQEYARIENHDYQEIAPGIWLPGKVKYESLEVTPELTPAKLSWSFEGTNHDWVVNRELPADTFELAFPEGTFVNDHRTPGR